MIVSTLIAAAVAVQPTPTPQPATAPVPTTEKKMACCEKKTKGEACSCCKDMASQHSEGMNHDGAG